MSSVFSNCGAVLVTAWDCDGQLSQTLLLVRFQPLHYEWLAFSFPFRKSLETSLSRPLVRAAQYLRMSTDHQECSIEIQSAAIAVYAATHDMGIVRSYVDAGKSGLTIARRKGLKGAYSYRR